MASGFNSRLLTAVLMSSALFAANAAHAQKVTVDADPAHVANTFSPVRSLGAAIDRLRTGTPDHLLKDPLLHEILGAGWQTVTYRQNTELMVEAWHWNPEGKWSNADKQEGYFVGNAEPAARKSIARGPIRCRIAASVAATATDGRASPTAISSLIGSPIRT